MQRPSRVSRNTRINELLRLFSLITPQGLIFSELSRSGAFLWWIISPDKLRPCDDSSRLLGEEVCLSVYKLGGISAFRGEDRPLHHGADSPDSPPAPLEPLRPFFLSPSVSFISSLSPKQRPAWLLYNLPRVSTINHCGLSSARPGPSLCLSVRVSRCFSGASHNGHQDPTDCD